jgi:hypothetical protein
MLLMGTLSGCATSGEPPIARVLPNPPAFAQPVTVAQPKKGEPLVAIAARERAGRLAANGRIKSFVEWYEGVRADYAK